MSGDTDRIVAAIAKHATLTLDGCWTQCACDGVWRGQQQWAGHVADAITRAVAGYDDEDDAKQLSLRGRITGIIRDNFSARVWVYAEDIADAVIDGLSLSEEWSVGDDESGRALYDNPQDAHDGAGRGEVVQHRYVTEWTAPVTKIRSAKKLGLTGDGE